MDATADSTVPVDDDAVWADDDDAADLWADDAEDDDLWADGDRAEDDLVDLWPWERGDDDALWPRCPMLILRDEDLVVCAAAMVRGVLDPVPTLWLVLLAGDGWTLSAPIELAGVPVVPDAVRAVTALTRLLAAVPLPARHVDPDTSLVAVIYRPDGGARGAPERMWTQSVLTAATSVGLPVRAVVAAGAGRVRLLIARAVTR